MRAGLSPAAARQQQRQEHGNGNGGDRRPTEEATPADPTSWLRLCARQLATSLSFAPRRRARRRPLRPAGVVVRHDSAVV